MSAVHWHLVRSGHPQVIGSQRRTNGDPFPFLPLFRTHLEADDYCRSCGLRDQGIRPRHNALAARHDGEALPGLSALVGQARADGINAIGVFVGFNLYRESCWEYYRISGETSAGSPIIEPLPEDERPV